MNGLFKIAVGLALTVGVVLAADSTSPAPRPGQRAASARSLPRLVDLGADKCIPCKAMAPILAELKAEYAGRFDVQFIDVWKNPEAATPYRIRTIPTQVFYAADGTELSRHQGFMAKDEIIARWKSHGIKL